MRSAHQVLVECQLDLGDALRPRGETTLPEQPQEAHGLQGPLGRGHPGAPERPGQEGRGHRRSPRARHLRRGPGRVPGSSAQNCQSRHGCPVALVQPSHSLHHAWRKRLVQHEESQRVPANFFRAGLAVVFLRPGLAGLEERPPGPASPLPPHRAHREGPPLAECGAERFHREQLRGTGQLGEAEKTVQRGGAHPGRGVRQGAPQDAREAAGTEGPLLRRLDRGARPPRGLPHWHILAALEKLSQNFHSGGPLRGDSAHAQSREVL